MFKVLLIDDKESNREIVSLCLEDCFEDLSKLSITEAMNGEEAIELVNHNSYDLIVLDLMMPQMDGFEFLRQKSKNPNVSSSYVLVVSARQESQTAIKALDLGAHDYIRLPFDEKEMSARLRAILRLLNAEELLGKSISFVEHNTLNLFPVVSIAHDLSNILSQFSNLDLLSLKLNKLLNQSSQDKELVNQAITLLSRTQKSIPWAMKICSGLMAVDPTLDESRMTNVKEVFSPIIDIFEYRLSLRFVDFSFQIVGDERGFECNVTELQRILLNLVSNALNALNDKKVGLKLIIEATFTSESLRVKIEDNGCGIEEEDLKRVFIERFSSSDRLVSTGIGLSYVKKVCDKNNWAIEIESQINTGTRVYLCIPLNS